MIELTDKIRKRFEIQLKKIFVGNSSLKNSRPVLNQLHYTKDGHLEITNSHIGVRLTDVHDREDSDEDFPNMDDLFKVSNDAETIPLTGKQAKLLEDHLNVLYKNKVETLRVRINKEGIFIESNDKHKVFHESGILQNFGVKEEIIFGINSRYLHDALMMFRLMKLEDIKLHVVPEKRVPISITSENLHYILSPVMLTR